MTTFLLPDDPITSLDAYLATDTGGLGIERAQRLGPAATIETCSPPGSAAAAAAASRPAGSGRASRRRPGPAATWCATAPRASPARSRTAPCCAPTRTSSSKGSSSPRSPSAPKRRSSASSAASSARREAVTRAVQEFQAAGICTDCKVTIVAGPDEYLFGEEKAMLEVIEGKPPLPRWFPPYEHGLFATAPQLGWEATPRSAARAVARTRRSSTTSRRWRTCPTSSPGDPSGSARWAPRSRPARSSPPSSATSSPPTSARSSSAPRCAPSSTPSAAASHQGARSRRCSPASPTPSSPPPASTCRCSYEGFQAIGSGMGAAGFIVYDDTDLHGRRRLPVLAVPVDRVVRPVPAVQDRLGRDHQAPRAARDRRRQRRRPALDRALAGPGHRRQPLLPRRRGASRWSTASCRRSPRSSPNTSSSAAAHARDASRSPSSLDLADGIATYDETFWRKRPDWTYDPDEPTGANVADR